jgi:hypothetical protein
MVLVDCGAAKERDRMLWLRGKMRHCRQIRQPLDNTRIGRLLKYDQIGIRASDDISYSLLAAPAAEANVIA